MFNLDINHRSLTLQLSRIQVNLLKRGSTSNGYKWMDPCKECITQQNGFYSVWLPSVLRTGYHVYRQHDEELTETNGYVK